MNRYRPLLVPLLLTLSALISLGLWQLERRVWKLGLIERIETRTTGDPIPLEEAKRFWAADRDVEYYRLALTGRFLHEHERHLYGLVNGEAGWRVLTPLDTQSGDIIFVDRGFVPEQFRDPATRAEGQLGGEVALTALARASEEGSMFTPDTQPSANRWFLRDVGMLNASLPDNFADRAVPFMAEVEPMAVPGGWPRGGVTRLQLPNRHLEYAITWFGLAASLALVFVFFARRQIGGDANVADRGGSV